MMTSTTLVRLLERRTRLLMRHLPAAERGNDTAVHQARVASRRLREAVPVLTDGLQGTKARKARRKLRRVTRALGHVRELDVALLLLDELAQTPDVSPDALTHVRAHIMAEREARRRIMLEQLAAVDREKVVRRLHSVRDAVAHPTPEHNWRAALAAKVATRARRLDKAIQQAGQVYSPDALHAVRIAAKKLRYTLELADESRAASAASAVKTLKRVQDALGRLHDLQVLQHHVAAVEGKGRTAALNTALSALSRHIEDRCRLLHGRYIARLTELQELVDRARRDIAVRITAHRRPAKMALPATRVASRGR